MVGYQYYRINVSQVIEPGPPVIIVTPDEPDTHVHNPGPSTLIATPIPTYLLQPPYGENITGYGLNLRVVGDGELENVITIILSYDTSEYIPETVEMFWFNDKLGEWVPVTQMECPSSPSYLNQISDDYRQVVICQTGDFALFGVRYDKGKVFYMPLVIKVGDVPPELCMSSITCILNELE